MKTGQKPTLRWLRPRDMHAAMTYAGMAKQGAWIGRIREGTIRENPCRHRAKSR